MAEVLPDNRNTLLSFLYHVLHTQEVCDAFHQDPKQCIADFGLDDVPDLSQRELTMIAPPTANLAEAILNCGDLGQNPGDNVPAPAWAMLRFLARELAQPENYDTYW